MWTGVTPRCNSAATETALRPHNESAQYQAAPDLTAASIANNFTCKVRNVISQRQWGLL
jgi:hypothetical protein